MRDNFNLKKDKVLALSARVKELLNRHQHLSDPKDALAAIEDQEQKLLEERFQIAVIGQMNGGKSTFSNALFFECGLLPMRATPHTAKLTIVRYAEEENGKAFFFTSKEWKEKAEVSTNDEDNLSRYYQKLVRNACDAFGSQEKVDSFLEQNQKAAIRPPLKDGLKQYAAKYDPDKKMGRFTSVVKRVEIGYPSNYLKTLQAEVVDTPGTNDPDYLSEKETLEYFRKADVVLLVVYKPGEKADIDFLKELSMIGYAGIFVVMNKIDTWPPEHRKGAVEAAEKFIRNEAARKDIALLDEVREQLSKCRVIPVSAQAALIARGGIKEVQDGAHHRSRLLKENDISDDGLLDFSGIDQIENEVAEYIFKTKGEYLISAPLQKGKGSLQALVSELIRDKEACGNRIKDWALSEST